MDKYTKERLDSSIERLQKIMNPKEIGDEEKYKYYLLLKSDFTFVILAIQKDKDIYMAKMRYNAPLAIELTLHEYFEYSYIYYGGSCRYWNIPKGEINTKDSIKRLKNG